MVGPHTSLLSAASSPKYGTLHGVSHPLTTHKATAELRQRCDRNTGNLDTNEAARAILAHRNTPCQDTGISPSIMLFGRPIRDHLPRYDMKLRPEWDLIAESREKALAKRVLVAESSSKHELAALEMGDSVQIQNQQVIIQESGTSQESSQEYSQIASTKSLLTEAAV